MSGGSALRAAWEAAQQQPQPAADELGALRKTWDAAQIKPNHSTAPFKAEEPPEMPSRKINMETPPLTSLAASPAQPAKQPFLTRMATHVGNTASGIPGVEATGAYAGSKMGGIPYQEALKRIRDQEATIPSGLRIAERMVGAAPLAAVLPGSPAVAGAIMGGANQALSADPMSGGERIARTGTGAAGGAVVGKGLDKLQMGLRALAPKFLGGTPDPASNIIARQAERAASAKNLYDAALAEGHANGATPAIQAYLAEPDIAARVAQLQKLDQFKHIAPDGPEMLDALHKSLVDEAHAITKGLAVQDPSKPNTGRFKLQDVQGKKQELVRAMQAPPTETVTPTTAQSPNPTLRQGLSDFDTRKGVAAQRTEGTVAQQMARQALERHSAEQIVQPPLRGAPVPYTIETGPGMMPTYGDAVKDFAQRSADINAVGKGMTASQGATKPTRPTFNQITAKNPKTPQTFSEWVKTASPSEIQAAKEGIIGDVGNAIHEPGKTLKPFRKATGVGADLLRRADSNDPGSMAAKLGLTFLTADPFNQ